MSAPFLQSAPGEEPVIVTGTFAAPAARLFQAWTEPASLKRWFGPEPGRLETVQVDLRVGGRWLVRYLPEPNGQDQVGGCYQVIQPNEQLVFTWEHQRLTPGAPPQRTPESLVTVTFTPQDNATAVRLVHSRIIQVAGRSGVGNGWNSAFALLHQVVSG